MKLRAAVCSCMWAIILLLSVSPAAGAPLLSVGTGLTRPVQAAADQNQTRLLFFFLLALPAIVLWAYLRLRQKKAKTKLREWESAYRNIEQRLEERAQKLRSINSMLHAEIAEHELTEEKLRKTRDYLNSIINSMPSVLISVTADGHITHWNASTERAAERCANEVVGKLLWQVYPNLPITPEMIQQAIKDGRPKVMESRKQENNGDVRFSDIIVYPLAARDIQEAVIRIDDVTPRIMIENMMIQNEKMLSLGEMAAGMAHEINNPLSAILQSVQNIERRLSVDLLKNNEAAYAMNIDLAQLNRYLQSREVFDFLATIRKAGERSARIVANMLSFARSGGQHTLTDLNRLIESCLELTDNNFETQQQNGDMRIELVRELGDNIPALLCSAPEIQQVLLNLLRNAAQALTTSEQSSPRITISTSCDTVYAKIKITDNGPGISQDVQGHIFEPFFTTKEVGQGTGLGLSISYFIITEQHGGSIEIDSACGTGTSFTIRLPLPST